MSNWITLGEDKEPSKVSKFLSRVGRKAKQFFKSMKSSIESALLSISIKYTDLVTAYFKKRTQHYINLRDRRDYGRPMLRDFPKYIGVGIYKGFGALFSSVGASLSNWKKDRELAEVKKDNTN